MPPARVPRVELACRAALMLHLAISNPFSGVRTSCPAAFSASAEHFANRSNQHANDLRAPSLILRAAVSAAADKARNASAVPPPDVLKGRWAAPRRRSINRGRNSHIDLGALKTAALMMRYLFFASSLRAAAPTRHVRP